MEEYEINAVRDLIIQVLNECTDLDILDLVYKILISCGI